MAKRNMPPKQPKEEYVDMSEVENFVPHVVAVFNTDRVNVREEPTKESPILFVARLDMNFYAEANAEGWTKVRTMDKKTVGYIMSEYVKEV